MCMCVQTHNHSSSRGTCAPVAPPKTSSAHSLKKEGSGGRTRISSRGGNSDFRIDTIEVLELIQHFGEVQQVSPSLSLLNTTQ